VNDLCWCLNLVATGVGLLKYCTLTGPLLQRQTVHCTVCNCVKSGPATDINSNVFSQMCLVAISTAVCMCVFARRCSVGRNTCVITCSHIVCVCTQVFSRSEHLRNHMLSHRVCLHIMCVCTLVFGRSEHLRNHMLSHHVCLHAGVQSVGTPV